MKQQENKTGTLYVVATPIGNLEDMTYRAVRILGEVDVVASEDTRHSRKLLSHYDIHTPLMSYYKDKEKERSAQIIEKLLAGNDVALVSDAGTPAISDPGAILVRAAHDAGIPVVPVPGPSALTAAVSVAGFGGSPFVFYGFLPSTKGSRRKFFSAIAADDKVIVFYESPRRILACLKECQELLGDRYVFVARELTKLHEETQSGLISAVLADYAERPQIKGEFVVVLAGAAAEEKPAAEDIDTLLLWCRDKERLSLRDAVRRATEELGVSRSEVYKKALALWEKKCPVLRS